MEEVTGATGEPLILWFFDTADNVAIGDGSTQFPQEDRRLDNGNYLEEGK